MRIDDAVDVAATVAAKYSVFQSEIFSVLLNILLTESADSRLGVFTVAQQIVEAKIKAAQKAQTTSEVK
jgi:hypothetical protein